MGTTYPIKAQVRLHGKMTRGERITGPSLPQGTSASLSIAHVGGVLTPVFFVSTRKRGQKNTYLHCMYRPSQPTVKHYGTTFTTSAGSLGIVLSEASFCKRNRGTRHFFFVHYRNSSAHFFSFCLGRDCRLGDMVQIPVLRSICLLRSLATKAQRGVVNKTQQAQV